MGEAPLAGAIEHSLRMLRDFSSDMSLLASSVEEDANTSHRLTAVIEGCLELGE